MSKEEIGYVLMSSELTFATITKMASHSPTDKYCVSYVENVHAAEIFNRPLRVVEKQYGVVLDHLIPIQAKAERVVKLHQNLKLSYCIT